MWGLTSQNSFFKWLALLWVYKTCIDRRCEGGKNGTLQVSDRPGNGRPKQWEDPWAFFAFEGSLFRLFKQGDAQWLQRRALAAADRGRDGDAIQLTQMRGDNKEILAETITLLQRGRKHAGPPPKPHPTPRRIRYCRSDETWREASASKHHSRSGPLLIFFGFNDLKKKKKKRMKERKEKALKSSCEVASEEEKGKKRDFSSRWSYSEAIQPPSSSSRVLNNAGACCTSCKHPVSPRRGRV